VPDGYIINSRIKFYDYVCADVGAERSRVRREEEKCWLAITSHVNMRCNKQLKGRSISGHTSDNIIFNSEKQFYVTWWERERDRVTPAPPHKKNGAAHVDRSAAAAVVVAHNRINVRVIRFCNSIYFRRMRVKHIGCLRLLRRVWHQAEVLTFEMRLWYICAQRVYKRQTRQSVSFYRVQKLDRTKILSLDSRCFLINARWCHWTRISGHYERLFSTWAKLILIGPWK
jgi:hypothetical protein